MHEEFYVDVKAKKHIVVPLEVVSKIKYDAQRTFGLHLAELSSEERIVRIVNILAVFVMKNPDIGYQDGMTYVVGLLLSVFSNEKEVFVTFCHVVENVYPSDFFQHDNRELGLHRELNTISKMAEVLRPKLINTLKAVFTPLNSKKKETDLTPFTLFIKRTTEWWIRSLFVPSLIVEDTYRVWDCILIYGFDFIVKFSLCLLSHNEAFIKNTVKTETKQLNLRISVDSLIISGNLTRIKLLRKIEKLPIEKMLKKAVNKNTYVAVKRETYLKQSEAFENDIKTRILRLRQTKLLIPKDSLTIESVNRLLPSLKSLSVQEKLSRSLFFSITNKELKWSGHLAGTVFNTFDQNGEDSLQVILVCLGLVILSIGSQTEKLGLIFDIINDEKLNEISLDTVCIHLPNLEKILDYRSKTVKLNIKSISQNFQNFMNKEVFISCFSNEPNCQRLKEIMEIIDSEGEIEFTGINFMADGRFSDTHSPLNTSGNGTPNSDSSFNDKENSDTSFNDIESKEQQETQISYKKSYEEVITNDTKAVFYFSEGEFDGINIEYEVRENCFKFFVGIGKLEKESVEEVYSFDQIISEKNAELLDNDAGKLTENQTNQNSEVLREVELPEIMKNHKDRSNCSRLCSSQKCGIY